MAGDGIENVGNERAARKTLSAGWAALGAAGTGLLLGALAVVADHLTGGPAAALILVASTGFSWAVGALFWGGMSREPGAAAVTGMVALVGAVITYYLVIAVWHTRPEGSALADAALVWGVIGAVAGPMCGVLGWYLRHGRRPVRQISVGIAGGLLTSQAISLLLAGAPTLTSTEWSIVGTSIGLSAVLILRAAWGRWLPLAVALAVPAAYLGGTAWSWLLTQL